MNYLINFYWKREKMKNFDFDVEKVISQIEYHLSPQFTNFLIKKEIGVIYKSKKHLVFEIFVKFEKTESSMVVKKFNKKILDWKQKLKREIENYDFLGLNFSHMIPERVLILPDLIVYKKIHGDNFQTAYLEDRIHIKSVTQLGYWFASLHAIGKIFGDSRLANFIVSHNNLYVIDYEDITDGDPIKDFSNLLSSFLDLEPGIFSNSLSKLHLKLCYLCLKTYLDSFSSQVESKLGIYQMNSTSMKFWVEEILSSLRKTASRRKIALLEDNYLEFQQMLEDGFLSFFNQDLSK